MKQARDTDPATSHEAAEGLRAQGRERARILTAFVTLGPMTDSELEAYARTHHWPYAASKYYRRRRSDLKNLGLIGPTGQRRKNAAGNSETVWDLQANLHRKEHTMDTNQPASFDEGAVIFRKLPDGTWGVEGVDLFEGDQVEVTTKDAEIKDIIVGEILEENYGVITARFEWVNTTDPDLVADGRVIFHKLPDDTWGIQGLDLAKGDTVTVSTRDGKEHEAIVGEIVEMDDNLATARYSWADASTPNLDDGRIIFRKNPNDPTTYLIQGRGLTPGSEVPVVKKSGKPVRVIVGEIVSEEDGLQMATYSWPKH